MAEAKQVNILNRWLAYSSALTYASGTAGPKQEKKKRKKIWQELESKVAMKQSSSQRAGMERRQTWESGM